MKKIFILALSLFVFVGMQAQDSKKLLKQASKSLGKYESDPAKNAGSIIEAIDLINQVLSDDAMSATAKPWLEKAKIYSAYSKQENNMKMVDPNFEFIEPNAALMAYESLKKVMDISTNKGDIKKALSTLGDLEAHLNNTGVALYQKQNYKDAFTNFHAAVEAHQILKANEKDSRLDDMLVYKDHIFFTAVSGYFGDQLSESVPYLLELYDAGTDQPMVYEALFNAYKDEDEAKALAYIEEGRTAFPDDTGILFAEINHYLAKEELNVLIDKLKLAIEKEPDNVTVYTTLGNVYDNLHQKAKKEEDMENSALYFDEANNYYGKALERDPNNFDATYSIGALYYNKAAGMVDDLNAYANDFSKAGTDKYNALKAEMDGIFDQARPYFEKAESIRPNDLNTLVALKEICARKNEFDKSAEYKTRIEAIQAEQGEGN